jgi:hypothetical protein
LYPSAGAALYLCKSVAILLECSAQTRQTTWGAVVSGRGDDMITGILETCMYMH